MPNTVKNQKGNIVVAIVIFFMLSTAVLIAFDVITGQLITSPINKTNSKNNSASRTTSLDVSPDPVAEPTYIETTPVAITEYKDPQYGYSYKLSEELLLLEKPDVSENKYNILEGHQLLDRIENRPVIKINITSATPIALKSIWEKAGATISRKTLSFNKYEIARFNDPYSNKKVLETFVALDSSLLLVIRADEEFENQMYFLIENLAN